MVRVMGRRGESKRDKGFRHEVGGRLRQARNSRGYTLEAVAEACGVYRQTVSGWESGRSFPSAELLVIVLDRYDVTADWILGRQPEAADADELKLVEGYRFLQSANREVLLGVARALQPQADPAQ